MTPPMPKTDRRHHWLALTLILSLLFSQWLGFGHAVAHGNGSPEFRQATVKVAGLTDHQKASTRQRSAPVCRPPISFPPSQLPTMGLSRCRCAPAGIACSPPISARAHLR